MKLTQKQLRKIIKEEKINVLNEQRGGRLEAFNILEDMLEQYRVPPEDILNYIIGNHLPGSTAFDVMTDAHDEFVGSPDDDDLL